MPKLGPAGMMSETAIRGMLNGIKKQLNSGKLPAPLLSKVLDHKQKLEAQLVELGRERIKAAIKKLKQEGEAGSEQQADLEHAQVSLSEQTSEPDSKPRYTFA